MKNYLNTKEEYYRIRAIEFKDPIDQAAQFLYLNRTNFNGIWRVNLNGQYNVPYGFKKYKNLFEYDRIKAASKSLKSANLFTGDFELCLKNLRSKDLVFLDPPYTVAHGKNGFIKYNEKLFSWGDQERLAQMIKEIKRLDAYYILTNANHDSVKELFGGIDHPITVKRTSTISGKKTDRKLVEELIFTNI